MVSHHAQDALSNRAAHVELHECLDASFFSRYGSAVKNRRARIHRNRACIVPTTRMRAENLSGRR